MTSKLIDLTGNLPDSNNWLQNPTAVTGSF